MFNESFMFFAFSKKKTKCYISNPYNVRIVFVFWAAPLMKLTEDQWFTRGFVPLSLIIQMQKLQTKKEKHPADTKIELPAIRRYHHYPPPPSPSRKFQNFPKIFYFLRLCELLCKHNILYFYKKHIYKQQSIKSYHTKESEGSNSE